MLLSLLTAIAINAQMEPEPGTREWVTATEEAYADFNDASSAISLIDSDSDHYADRRYAGKSRQEWQQLYADKRADLTRRLGTLPAGELSATDTRAIQLIQNAVAGSSATPDSLAPVGECKTAQRQDLQLSALQEA